MFSKLSRFEKSYLMHKIISVANVVYKAQFVSLILSNAEDAVHDNSHAQCTVFPNAQANL